MAALSRALRDALLCVSPVVPDLQRDVVAQAAACGWCVQAPTFFVQKGDSVSVVLNVLPHSPGTSPSTENEPATCRFWLLQSNDRRQLFLFFKLYFCSVLP